MFYDVLHQATPDTTLCIISCCDSIMHWQTHLKFIQSLYSRSEAEVAYITGERRLPILLDKN